MPPSVSPEPGFKVKRRTAASGIDLRQVRSGQRSAPFRYDKNDAYWHAVNIEHMIATELPAFSLVLPS
jgi:hypothetical protein